MKSRKYRVRFRTVKNGPRGWEVVDATSEETAVLQLRKKIPGVVYALPIPMEDDR